MTSIVYDAPRMTKSSPGDAALRSSSSLSTVGTASPRSYRAYAFRDDAPRREATSRKDAPLASRRRRRSNAVIAAASLPDTSNSCRPRGCTSARKSSRFTIVSIQSAIISSASFRERPCVIASSRGISASQNRPSRPTLPSNLISTPAGAPENRLRQPFTDLTVSRNRFLTLTVSPNVVPPAAAEESPAALRQASLQFATFHEVYTDPCALSVRVREA